MMRLLTLSYESVNTTCPIFFRRCTQLSQYLCTMKFAFLFSATLLVVTVFRLYIRSSFPFSANMIGQFSMSTFIGHRDCSKSVPLAYSNEAHRYRPAIRRTPGRGGCTFLRLT